ncbi:sucrose phosphorylase [Actinomyces glycerinitolerans]|uniref:Sucrose phosphorylase gfta n=1 Tax=Actinomyces glycerinitolerans TaxID=1892869 RepID=A0A1M4RYH2_9ACTO|nr:sucrose phosphorylase [Actinomyces glycerinitolerans]SHE24979.1 sucrose phosphorylase gfta [Actinomyces glycerinitolerans]
MKPVVNQAMLITYADSLGGNLMRLRAALDTHLPGAFGGLHILPFFRSSGDRGFAVIDYDDVDPAFGDWSDIDALGKDYFLMADFMLNHASIRSREFLDYMARGDDSTYRSMFIDWDEFWPEGEPSDEDMELLYRRKPGGPVKEFTRADGRSVRIWNTFFDEQVDIDPYDPATQAYYERNLSRLAQHVAAIRFDAFAYATKRPGTSCFFVEPDVWEVLEIGLKPLKPYGTVMLPEIHENYRTQMKMSRKGHWVYDFALPMLTLHALFTGRTDRLAHWLEVCPRRQFTTLDTHDGIGVVDVAGLLSDEEIDLVSQRVDANTANLKGHGPALPAIHRDGKKVRYQLMTTYYSALGEDDAAFLLARVFQLFVPGIPQLYYVGALFGANDIAALDRVGDPRAANRHDYSEAEIAQAVARPAVQTLLAALRLRNTFPAFNGHCCVSEQGQGRISVTWDDGACAVLLEADFSDHSFVIKARRRHEPWRQVLVS